MTVKYALSILLLLSGLHAFAAPDVPALKKEAKLGNADSQFKLGLLYFKGDGVTRDQAQAQKWYQLAAKNGSAKALHVLSVMYRNGCGFPKDVLKGESMLAQARSHATTEEKKFIDSLEKSKNLDGICEAPRAKSALKPYLGVAFLDDWHKENRAKCPAERANPEHPAYADPKKFDLEKLCQCYLVNVGALGGNTQMETDFEKAGQIDAACRIEAQK